MSSSKSFEPFCTAILRTLRRSLNPTNLPKPFPPHTHFPASQGETTSKDNKDVVKESAILIPLMNIRDEPHILMQVRNKNMRVHAGEISFPGGKADKSDESLIHTALRETQEELSIPPSNIEILGMLEPAYSLGNKSRVWPFVGFIHSDSQPFPSIPQTLPSLPIEKIIPNKEEVSSIVLLPLSSFNDFNKLSIHYFRLNLNKPYYRINAKNYILPKSNKKIISKNSIKNKEILQEEEEELRKNRIIGLEENGEFSQDLEIWGLSGWFLNKLAERAGWLNPPPKGNPVD
ncbi:uncharacterized protein I206_101929 [Kwoniella pini CBS 10737]|uniref:Nudix hydrolase domain-containing protein n=1 Tax=Kwoniella pini CBS 10737 TaxID=1296096 RepID=A0A1B9HVA2_9TREE|nr:uncharacterized protein I206_06980 [Kwoniella pini CBS 10737]OCF47202.1 hypothetical protein I206_06980 [Kwoniella pini CBS 10737]